jgi:prepilin peptidase CpaA
MFFLILFLVCLFMSIAVGVLAGWSDIRGMVIPNIYSGIIIGLFLIAFAVLALGGRADIFAPFWTHLVSAFLMFVLSAGLFAAGILGAADSKLGTAFALWVGIKGLAALFLYMTLAGGLLGLVALGLKKWKPLPHAPAGSWPARVQAGESKVPYGVAIVFGALIAFYHSGYFDPSVLARFLASGSS